MKLVLGFLLCFVIYSLNSLKVTIYYESLCPGCRQFITTQFYPASQELSPYLDWYFVPYGHATRRKINGKWNFTCQHGPQECYANKVEACAFFMSEDKNYQVKYLNCVDSSDDPGSNKSLSECCDVAYLDWNTIDGCMKFGIGDQLLAKYGEMTDEINPKYVPAVAFDDVYNITLQDAAISNFLDVACKLLSYAPKACSKLLMDDIKVIGMNKID